MQFLLTYCLLNLVPTAFRNSGKYYSILLTVILELQVLKYLWLETKDIMYLCWGNPFTWRAIGYSMLEREKLNIDILLFQIPVLCCLLSCLLLRHWEAAKSADCFRCWCFLWMDTAVLQPFVWDRLLEDVWNRCKILFINFCVPENSNLWGAGWHFLTKVVYLSRETNVLGNLAWDYRFDFTTF